MPEPSRTQPRAFSHVPAEIAGLAFEYSSELILSLDAAGTIVSVNPAALAQLGYAADQLVGKPWLDLLDPGSRSKGLGLLREAAAHPTDRYELNLLTASRSIVLIGLRAVPIRVEAPAPAEASGYLLIGTALSAMVTATERLVALNQRLSTLFAIAETAARSLLLPDMLGEVLRLLLTELNAQAGTVLLADQPIDMAPQRAAAHHGPVAFQLAVQQGLAPELAERLRVWPAIMPERFMQGQAFVIEASDPALGEHRIGELGSAGPLLMLVAIPIRGERQLLGWLCVITDRYQPAEPALIDLVSSIGALLGPAVENARLYSALVEASGHLGAVLDSIDSGVLLIDTGGVIRYANKRLGELLETDVGAWPGQPRAERLGRLLVPLPEPGRLFEDTLWVSQGPQRRILRCFTDRIADRGGASAGTIEVYTDVTAIHQMDRLKDEFIAAAAHDLKTPVTAVKGYSQIALRLAQRLNDQRFAGPLEMINARSNDLAYLMDTLLDMSRIQAGRLRLDLEPVEAQALVVRAARHFALDSQRQRRQIGTDQPGEPIVAQWDAPRIERLLTNLIGNALKYSPSGGEVLLRVRRLADQDAVELAVTDHGIGIPPDEREHVFERFYRARQASPMASKARALACISAVAWWKPTVARSGPPTRCTAGRARRSLSCCRGSLRSMNRI